MSASPIDVFFYGLFMDTEALRAQGLCPINPRKARVAGMTLKLGRRATLAPQAGGEAHGLVMSLRQNDIDKLYAEPSVAAYRPEQVIAEYGDGSAAPAICYNLDEPGEGLPDADYALKLRAVAVRMGLPPEYVAGIGR